MCSQRAVPRAGDRRRRGRRSESPLIHGIWQLAASKQPRRKRAQEGGSSAFLVLRSDCGHGHCALRGNRIGLRSVAERFSVSARDGAGLPCGDGDPLLGRNPLHLCRKGLDAGRSSARRAGEAAAIARPPVDVLSTNNEPGRFVTVHTSPFRSMPRLAPTRPSRR
jgi:hypothetical protein